MIETPSTPESSTGHVLEYQLTEADVHRYCVYGRPRACWRSCRGRKKAMVVLVALGLFLIGICYLSHGARSGTLALATTIVVLTALAWSRRALVDRRVCRLAREMSLPCVVRLAISAEGIAKEPGKEPDDLGRTFEWSEVVGVDRLDSLTVIHLRPAGGVLIVPDRAFPTDQARVKLVENIRSWRAATAG